MLKRSFCRLTLLGFFLILIFSSNDCSNQENIVTGKVFPAGMNVPMQGVAIKIVNNDSTLVLSDGDGYFKLKVSSFPVELVFSKKTYSKQIIRVQKPSDIVVYMNPDK